MKPQTIIVSLCLVLGSAWGTYFPQISLSGASSAHSCLQNATVGDLFTELQQIYEMSQIREAQNTILMETLSRQNIEFSSLLREEFKKSESFSQSFESFVSTFTERISILETSFKSTQEYFSSLESRIETITTQISSFTSTSTNTETSTSTFTSEYFSEQLLLIQQQVQQLQQQQQTSTAVVDSAPQETSGIGHHFVLRENTKAFDRLAKSGGLVELGGEYFYFRSDPLMRWDHAASVCRELGMRMLTLEKKDKTEKVFEYIKTNTRFAEKHFWLGAMRITKQDGSYIYVWQSMLTPVRENSWEVGQPDNLENEECVEIMGDANKLSWHNTGCDDNNGVICEMIVS